VGTVCLYLHSALLHCPSSCQLVQPPPFTMTNSTLVFHCLEPTCGW
jgi:hypothetical protein